MEALLLLLLVLVGMPLPLMASPRDLRSHELIGATVEMERANYFTFVTLINMSPGLVRSNVTFLMPHDRLLAGVPHLSPEDFLLRHSIPSPLLFETLRLLPSGSVLPSSSPGYFLSISNAGRASYLLNNVRLVSPNICSSPASTIRCHGIDGVLSQTSNYSNATTPCPSTTHPPSPSNYDHVAPVPAPSSQLLPPTNNKTLAVAPSPAASSAGGTFATSFMVLVPMMGLLVY